MLMKRWILMLLVVLCVGLPALAAAAEEEIIRTIPAWPLVWRRVDDSGKVESDYLASFIHYEWEKNRSAFVFRPYIYWTETDLDRDYYKVSALFRLFNYEREGTSTSFYIAPLYWSWADATSLHTINLIPPYYHRVMPGEDIRHVWPFYSGISKGNYREWGGLYPLIRFGRDPVNNVELDQFLLYYRKKEQDRSYTTVFPLYFSKEDGAEGSTWVLPLYYSRYDATTLKRINLFPPFYQYREPGAETLHVWPFYSEIEKGSYREWGSLYPIIRFGRDPVNNVELDQFLLYYRKKEQERSYTTVFPLYFSKEDGVEGSTWLLPLYYSRHDATTLKRINLFPPFYQSREPGAETLHVWPFYSEIEKGSYREWGSLYPIIRFGRDPQNNVELDQFLLYYRKQEQDRSYTTFFPLYFHKEGGAEKSTWFLPVYFSRSDATTLHTVNLIPPYYHHKDPGEETLHVWPFYSKIEKGSYQEYSVLYPLFRYGRDPELQYELDYYLLYYRKQEPDRSFTTFFPLYFKRVEGAERSTWFLPVYFSRSDATTLHTINLIPPYYHHREPGEETLHVWPFYSKIEKGSYQEWGSLYPLFRHGRDPELQYELDYYLLYYRKQEQGRSFTTFFPLWYSSQTPELRWSLFVPAYYHREDETTLKTLAPFYYHNKEPGQETSYYWPFYRDYAEGSYREHSVLYPLFRHGRDPELQYELDYYLLYYRKQEQDRIFSTFLPLWYSSRKPESTWHLFLPIYYDSTTESETTRFIAPTYYQHTSPESSVYTLFPLFVKKSRPDGRSLYVFPTYFVERTSTTKLRTFIPFYVDYKGPESEVLTFVPLYFRRTSAESAFTTVLPLYYDYHKTDFDLTLGVPVYLKYRSGPYTFKTIFPFYYATEDTAARTSFTYYFPFYGESRRGAAATRHFLLFPLFDRYEDTEAQLKGWDALWPLVHYESSPTTRTVRVPPFYWADRSPEKSYTVFFPVYWEFVKGESSYQHIIPFYSVHKEGDWQTSRYVLWLLYTDKRDTKAGVWEQDAVFSLYGRRVEGDRERTWVFPFYYHRSDPGSRLTLALPVLPYYHSVEAERESQHLIPVYSKMKEGSYTEYASLWPLFRHGRDPEKQYELDYYLLYYRKQEQGRTFTTFFPLYGKEKEGDRHVEWLVPAFYHRHEGPSLKTIGLLYYRSREPGKETYYLWPFYRNYAEGSYREYSVLYPLFRHGRDPVNQNELDYYLLYYRKQEQDRSFTTFFPLWYSSQTPESSWHLFLPVYFSQSDSSSQMALAPLYYSSKDTGQETFYLWPFYRDHAEGSYREYSVLYPLFRHGRDPEKQYELDYYLLYYRKQEQDRTFMTFFPLWYSSQTPESSWRLFLPVYYDRSDGSSQMALAPLYYSSKEPGQETFYLWPFYRDHAEGSYREYSVLYPLFRHGRDPVSQYELDYYLLYYRKQEQGRKYTLFFPLYGKEEEGDRHVEWLIPAFYHKHEGSSLKTLAPLYYRSREADQETFYLWPFYRNYAEGSYREYSVLYPLFRHGRDPVNQYELDYYLLYYRKQEQGRTYTLFLPLYGKEEEGARHVEWLIPAYYHREDGSTLKTLAPLYYHNRESGQETFYYWPFYRNHAEGSYREYSVLYPLFRHGRDAERQYEFDYYLLYYRKQEQDRSFATFFPLWWHKDAGTASTDAIPFLYWNEHDRETGNKDLSLFWLVPPQLSLFRYTREGTTVYHRLFPFYSYNSDEARNVSNWSLLWFIFSYESEGEFAQQSGFLWKVITYERKDAETYDFRFLWRLIRKSRTPTSATVEFNPIYYYEERMDKGYSFWAVVFGLVGRETFADGRTKICFFCWF